MKSILFYSLCIMFFICDFHAVRANTYEVINVNNTGAGSFRQAITDANANAGPDSINFNIAGTGPFSIVLASALPNISGAIIINGTTQPGFVSGTQATYVKVGSAYTGTIFSAINVTGITIKGLDISYQSVRSGVGISFNTCSQTLIIDNFIRNRNSGISINGGQDHTVQNNDLLATSSDFNNPALSFLNITPGNIASGLAVSGNKFGGNGLTALRIQNMNNVLVGDTSVVGANVVLEDNSGLTAMGAAGHYVLYFINVNNITVDNVDVSYLSGGQNQSIGIYFQNNVTNSTITIKNCDVKNRWAGILCGNGKDYTIKNNNVKGSGEGGQYAIELSNLSAAAIPGGILMSGNQFGFGTVHSQGGLKISNMNDLIIGDSITGVQIKIEDNSGFNTVLGNTPSNRGALFLNQVSNITIDNIDASYSLGGAANSFGIRIDNGASHGNIVIKNCLIRNRYAGLYCNDGKDYTVTGNDLRGSGWDDNYALVLSSIAEGAISGGVLVHTNLYGYYAPTNVLQTGIGLYVGGMSNLTIGDANTGVQIKIEDNSGMNTFGSNSGDRRGLLYLDDVSNIIVDDLDLSYTLGGIQNGFGIFVENESSRSSGISTAHKNVTIKNCLIKNRGAGIRVRGGKDYTIINNDLRGSGHNNYWALELGNIQPGNIPGGVLVHSNLFGTNVAQVSNAGVYINAMNDLTIGDATTGVNIKLEDNSGLNQIAGSDVANTGALYLNTVNNIMVNSLDCSKVPTGQGISWGIRVANSATLGNITITNCLAGNRQRGIWVDNGKDYTITNNNMIGSGGGTAAFELSNIIPGTIPTGIIASGNTFGTPNFNKGVVISNIRNLNIGDASVTGANIVLEDICGLNQCVGTDYNSNGALLLSNVDSLTIDNVDCSKVTAGASNSYGIYVSNGVMNQSVIIKNCKADNRYRGINCRGGKDYTVQNNTITNSGWDGEANALDFRDVTAGTLTGGVLVSGNTFGNVPITNSFARAAVRFDNMSDLTIGDATTGGNVKLEDGNGMTAVGFDQSSTYYVMYLNSIKNSIIDNIEISSAYTSPAQRNGGIRISGSYGNGFITVKDCNIQNRRLGLLIGNGNDYTVTGNNFTGSGISNSEPAVYLAHLQKSMLDAGIAMSNNTFGGTNANTALRVENMSDFTIGDNSVSGADIVFADGVLSTVGNIASSGEYVIYGAQLNNVTIDNVNLSRNGATPFGLGIGMINGIGNKNNSILNCGIANRRTGIYCSGGTDYTIQNDTLTSSGIAATEPAIYLNGVTEGSLPGGVVMSGNIFGGTNTNAAIRFETMKNVVVGDASVTNRTVTIEDGALATVGNNANSNESVIYFSNVSNSTVDNVDFTRTGSTQYGIGLRVDNNINFYPFTIKNNTFGTRRTGIYANVVTGLTIDSNLVNSCGAAATELAMYLLNTTFSTGKSIHHNTFSGTFTHGLRLENVNDVIIGDSSVVNVELQLEPYCGINKASTRAIHLENTNRVDIEQVSLSLTGTTSGTGLYVVGGSYMRARSLTVQKRVDGIDLVSGNNHTIQCSDLSLNTDALQIAAPVSSMTIEQNSFTGNTAYAINSAATVKAENNYFGGAAPPVGTPNGVTASVDVTPYLTTPPSGCPSSSFAEIELTGNLNLIEDGSLIPTTANFTDFNSTKISVPVVRTFTINNRGVLPLNITSISFSGSEAMEFVAGALTPVSPIPAGDSATFTVTFTPTATGARNATMNIANDDSDEGTFDVGIKGTGKAALVVTKIADTNDGVCDADCSLREAITAANSNADADVIEFNIGGGGAQTIVQTLGVFPTITQPLMIDGSTQPGWVSAPLITINPNSNITSFNASNVTGLTIKYLDISRPDANYDGTGVDLTSCNEVFILNNIFKNRHRGVYSNGGRDHTIKNNDFRRTGVNSNLPIIHLNAVSSRLLPNSVDISGNLYGDATGNNRSAFGIRIDNMSNLIIGDASVVAANIKIEDGSGFNATSTGDNYALWLNSVSNITIDNLDLTATTYGYQGWGIRIDNTSANKNITIKNCKINNRYSAIYCGSGKDYTIQNNDLQNCGNDQTRPALWLNGITEDIIPKGIIASGNLFGTGVSRIGLRIDNMSNLLIGNQTVVGANITLEDASGMRATGRDGDYYCIYLIGVSNTTIDKVDLNSTIGFTGWGIRIENTNNHSNITVKNCKINNRYCAIYCGSGKDYTIINNDLTNSGNDNSRPAIWFNSVRPLNIPKGMIASGNLFGGTNARTALRVDGVDGLVVGDASVVGANIKIEDNSGANNMNCTDLTAVLYFSGVSNLTVDNVDVSRSFSGREGTGIYLDNSGNATYKNFTIKNCLLKQHHVGIWVNGGKDLTLTNNDFRYSGFYDDRPALYLNSITAGTLPGGILMSGNLFGGSFNSSTSEYGIRIDNMRDLIIGDTSVVGRNITIEDGSGLNEVGGADVSSRGCMKMNSVRNIIIDNVDFSKATGGQANSFGLYLNGCLNSVVKNCKGGNRFKGFHFNSGRDYTVFNNNLTGSGQSISYPGLFFANVQGQAIPIGISAYGNTFGGSAVRTALRVDNIKDLIVGDASVSGAHIVLEDNSGVNNCTATEGNSNSPVLFFTVVSNMVIDNVDASRPSGKDRSGIYINNSSINSNVTVRNCNFNNYYRGMYITGGRDYTITNNSFLNSGYIADQPAIYLSYIQSNSLPGGILMSGNTFGGTNALSGVRFEHMRDLIIGDTSVVGRNITFEDNCGLNNHAYNSSSNGYNLIHLVNVNNATIDNVDVSRPVGATPAQDLTGIRIDNSSDYGPVTIKNCDARRHRSGIILSGGQNYTVNNNDLRGCGFNSEEPAFYINSISQLDASIPMGLTASGNKFGSANSINMNCGIRLENIGGIKITNIAGPGNHIVVTASDSLYRALGTAGNFPSAIMLRNTSGIVIDSLNLNFTGTQTGTGIYCHNDAAGQYGNIFSNNLIKNRRLGIRINNGSDYTLTGNDFQTTGIADDEPAIRLEHVVEGNLSGGVSISGNKFGGTNALYGLKFVNMSNLKISDGTFGGTNVNLGLYGTNGLSEVAAGTGYVLHLSSVCNTEVNSLDLSRSGSTRQGTGIRLSSGMGNTIQKIYAQGRDNGLQISGSVSETIKCNTLYDNNFGMDFLNSTITGLSLINNSMMCNTTGIKSAVTGTLNATSNYWGAANGPTNLGGTGNGYTGTVNANSFLTAPDACANIVPNTDAFGNNVLIEDGDITPSINDGTLVCGIPIGQNIVTNYTIKNNGGGIMRLIGPNPVTVVPVTHFTVDSQPSDLELAPGESTIIGIKFAPTAIGQQNAVVNVANKSCDNNPYNFTIQGNGCNPSTAVMSRDTAICIGKPGSVKLTIVGGTAPFTVTLSDGSVHTLNANGVNYITRTPVTTTTYSVTKIYDANNCCADFSGSSTITVNTLPTATITVAETSGNTNNDGILCAGASATLDAGIFSSWLWNTSATDQSISANTTGTYTVTVTDVNGCTATDDQLITVNPHPTPNILVTETSGTNNNDGILCSGDMATLDAGTYTAYLWSTNATTQTITSTTTQNYIVTVTNTNGCIGTDNQMIQVNPLPAASFNNALIVCPGTTTVQLDINITAGTAPFTVILSDASSHTVMSSGISQLAVSVNGGPGQNTFTISSIVDVNGCSGTSSGVSTVDFESLGEIELRGNNIIIVDGDPSPDPDDHTDFGQTTSAPITRTFKIKNIGNLDLALQSGAITITGTNASLFTLGNITLPATINGPNGMLTFEVTYTPITPGIHTATINIASSDCDESPFDFAIKGEFVCSPPSITSCPNSTIIVPNDAGLCNAIVSYIVTANGTPAPTYSYVFTGATMGSGSGTGSNSTFLKGNTLVTVTATNPCGAPTCMFTITVNDAEKPVITRLGAATIELCKNDSYTDAGATAIDNCDGNLTSSISTVNPVNTANPATYTVTYNVADLAGNAAIQITRTVIVHDLPAMTCPADFDACKTAGNITLSGATPSGGIYSGSGVSGGIFDPIAAGTGAHTITYTFTDGFGCIGTCIFVITVFDPPIFNVNDNMYYCTLAEAVAASLTNDGDELQIPTGVYNDPCIVVNKSVMITSVGGSVEIQCLQMNGVGKAMKLGGDITINQLTLTNGHIRTNGKHLKCGTITGGSATSYVITD
jgi:CSLREA domain-containing protein